MKKKLIARREERSSLYRNKGPSLYDISTNVSDGHSYTEHQVMEEIFALDYMYLNITKCDVGSQQTYVL